MPLPLDRAKHLKKMGLANQTTMYKKETQAIGKLFEKTMMVKYAARRTSNQLSPLLPLTAHLSPLTAHCSAYY